MPRLTREEIQQSRSDKELLEKLLSELQLSVPASLHEDLDEFVAAMEDLPPGIRAMASTYQLDVSMAFDDLGWHFANWHHHGYCKETSFGLKELEAFELSEIFDKAYSITCHQWDLITELLNQSFEAFSEWYFTSELDATLAPLNRRMWEVLKIESPDGEGGVFRYWLSYARKYPDRVVL